jgi:hypothetical protein
VNSWTCDLKIEGVSVNEEKGASITIDQIIQLAPPNQHLTLAVVISDPGVVDSLKNYTKISEKPKVINLSSCFDEFSKQEDLKGEEKYKCSFCSKDQEAKKKLEIFRLPKVLIIQLKRFSQTKNRHS